MTAETTAAHTPRLAKVKAGDPLAYVHHGGMFSPNTSEKVFVVKKNPKTVVINLNGVQTKVDLDGHLFMGHVEPWDDATEAARARRAEEHNANKELELELSAVRLMPAYDKCPSASDIVDSPELWSQIKAVREQAIAQTAHLCEQMRMARTVKIAMADTEAMLAEARSAPVLVNGHYGPGNIAHDGPSKGCLDCAHLECP